MENVSWIFDGLRRASCIILKKKTTPLMIWGLKNPVRSLNHHSVYSTIIGVVTKSPSSYNAVLAMIRTNLQEAVAKMKRLILNQSTNI